MDYSELSGGKKDTWRLKKVTGINQMTAKYIQKPGGQACFLTA